MTQRFEQLFTRLASKKEGAFIPFVNLCDPSPETSFDILCTLIESGADALECGIPFSDPSADGPVITTSSKRALKNGSTTALCMDVLRRVRERYPDTPISLMLYVNLVFAPGIDHFFSMAKASGVDAVLIPDVPVTMRELDPAWDAAADANDIALIALVPPSASEDKLTRLAAKSSGYTYLMSRVGITGVDQSADLPIHRTLEVLTQHKAAPIVLGFGISRPEHIKAALASGVSGCIVGSAIVQLISEHLDDKPEMLNAISAYASEMKAATRA